MSNHANQLFEATRLVSKLEDRMFDALVLIAGGDPDEPNTWPFKDIIYDGYDHSFEFLRCKDGLTLTDEQQKACGELGFQRCWLQFGERFKEGYRELYYTFPRPGEVSG